MNQRDLGLGSLLRLGIGQHGSFSRSQATAVGVNARALRRLIARDEIVTYGANVFLIPGAPDQYLQAMKAATLAAPGSAVAGRAACILHDLGDADALVSRSLRSPAKGHPQVDLWLPRSSRMRDIQGVIPFRNADLIPSQDLTTANRIPVVSAAVALTQIGVHIRSDIVHHCLDDFERQYEMSWLLEVIERTRGQRRSGFRVLDELLNRPERIQGVTDSWMERMIAELARQSGLPEPVLQFEVIVEGRHYRIDVAFPSIRLGIEGHSRTHHFGLRKSDADNVRDHDLALAGWETIYVTWSQVGRPAEFVDFIVALVKRRALDLGVPLVA